MTARCEVSVLTDCETFCLAFTKLMLDGLTDSPLKEIQTGMTVPERVERLIPARFLI